LTVFWQALRIFGFYPTQRKMQSFTNVYLYARTVHQEDVRYVEEALTLLQSYDVNLYYHEDFFKATTDYPSIGELIPTGARFSVRNLSLHPGSIVIALGGDGTMLRVIHLLRGRQIPVLGINLGRLGFLAGVKKTEIREAFNQLMSGQYLVEERTLIGITSKIEIFDNFPYALNEFTIRRLDSSSMINVSLYINDELLNSYWADGLLVSTPTGSTAYSLSCGGPILFPKSGNFVITAVAPHNLSVRPVVISDTLRIKLQVKGRANNFMVTLDSRHAYITREQEITLEKAPFKAQLVYVGSSSFMKRIREKLHWGEDRRN